ncbi:uncharacterized protein LOC123213806 [Mangifera indica]|uniref:uncharacterized protein LOC123213806 n=1 Tax=Mangifera indica TaxID=29780 RepID=UPI001CFB07C2|nr:uncharacterized protein LOC123213806 [Mangifera indica]
MVFVSGLQANCSALIHPAWSNKLPCPTGRCNSFNFLQHNATQPISRGGIGYWVQKGLGHEHVNSVGRDYQHRLSFDDDIPDEPLLLTCVKEAIWALRSLFVFLAEQPSQLKYIEWPGFQHTLKTATLTLVLVGVLIVALSSTDSFLSYLLGLLLRRTP